MKKINLIFVLVALIMGMESLAISDILNDFEMTIINGNIIEITAILDSKEFQDAIEAEENQEKVVHLDLIEKSKQKKDPHLIRRLSESRVFSTIHFVLQRLVFQDTTTQSEQRDQVIHLLLTHPFSSRHITKEDLDILQTRSHCPKVTSLIAQLSGYFSRTTPSSPTVPNTSLLHNDIQQGSFRRGGENVSDCCCCC